MTSLKNSYNALSPVNQLPTEILSDIFTLLAESGRREYRSSHKGRAQWLRVTHVCRQWRDAAMECTALWSSVLLFTPQLAEAMLVRSMSSPLSLEFDLKSKNTVAMTRIRNIISRVLHPLHRFRSVEISGHMDDNILANFSKRAPLLENLSLCYRGEASSTLPHNFLQGGVHNLKRLVLEDLSVSGLPVVPSLTHLRLVEICISDYTSVKNLLDCIRGMSQLQSLELLIMDPIFFHGHRPPSMKDVSGYPAIECKALRTVELLNSMCTIHALCTASRMPGVRSLALTFLYRDDDDGADFLEKLLSSISKLWRGKDLNHALSLSIPTADGRARLSFHFDIDAQVDNVGHRMSELPYPPLRMCFSPQTHGGFSAWQLFQSITSILVDYSSLHFRVGPRVDCHCWSTALPKHHKHLTPGGHGVP